MEFAHDKMHSKTPTTNCQHLSSTPSPTVAPQTTKARERKGESHSQHVSQTSILQYHNNK